MLLQAREGNAEETKRRHASCDSVGHEGGKDWTRFVGDYSFMGTLAQVYADGGRMKVKVRGHGMEIVPLGSGNFRIEKKILGIFPVRMGFITFEKCALSGERILPHEIPAQWRKRLGEYRLVNPDEESVVHFKHVRLIIEDGFLQFDVDSDQPEAQGKMVVMPFSDDAASILGASSTGGVDGTLVGRHSNSGERIWFSGYLFERVRSGDGNQE